MKLKCFSVQSGSYFSAKKFEQRDLFSKENFFAEIDNCPFLLTQEKNEKSSHGIDPHSKILFFSTNFRG